MSRTYKDKDKEKKFYSKLKVGKNIKKIAKTKKHSFPEEADPRALKLQLVDEWDVI